MQKYKHTKCKKNIKIQSKQAAILPTAKKLLANIPSKNEIQWINIKLQKYKQK